eukprot:CAMPEP_0173387270 /NCGR_PEP_ID=MMETSP1356-20130122/9788_1 /TAXON_ID=77927 ORGANISM="Hemiselmis virescens, Strain PCC157" /NCGR_SAMPLE_ID=MMETSP1356 /ASSEMBLY_ACC=CAM_ASM_000847 /LENGTH=192 /DNA_ID=CAMNT_0014343807 /DNA_START=37 /DNA_END=615 /DNA_ORIENTATION=+
MSTPDSPPPVGGHSNHQKVKEWQAYALNRSPIVKFMMEHMGKCGCPVDDSYFTVRHCDESVGGGFDALQEPHGGIVLCQNHVRDYKHAETTLTHELVHAYDNCRAFVDWNNCAHHACSEIRAAMLSGDCKMMQELARGNTGWQGQGGACIKRRAILSVSMNPACQGEGVAEKAVEDAYARCSRDTAPFDRVP